LRCHAYAHLAHRRKNGVTWRQAASLAPHGGASNNARHAVAWKNRGMVKYQYVVNNSMAKSGNLNIRMARRAALLARSVVNARRGVAHASSSRSIGE